MALKKPSSAVEAAKKEKFRNKKTKWEKRGISRRYARKVKGKKPLAEPLTIAPAKERQASLKQGKMVFYNGKNRIELDLVRESKFGTRVRKLFLQGVYRAKEGALVTLRSSDYFECLMVTQLIPGPAGNIKGEVGFGSFVLDPDLGHMVLSSFRGQGLGLKAVSKTERHVRSGQGGKHRFETQLRFKRLFEKLGYKPTKRADQVWQLHEIEKRGKLQPIDDLEKFHRIEAIDPKTGKARIFTFPIKRKSV